MMTSRLPCTVRKKVHGIHERLTYRLTERVTYAIVMVKFSFGLELGGMQGVGTVTQLCQNGWGKGEGVELCSVCLKAFEI